MCFSVVLDEGREWGLAVFANVVYRIYRSYPLVSCTGCMAAFFCVFCGTYDLCCKNMFKLRHTWYMQWMGCLWVFNKGPNDDGFLQSPY